MSIDDETFRKLYEQRWCSLPALVEGHKIECQRLDGHDGDCEPLPRWLRHHDCQINGCESGRLV